MKSILIILILTSTSGLAQIDAFGAVRLKETITIDPGGHPLILSHNEERAAGDIIVADDLTDFTNWLSVTEDGTSAEWSWAAETPEVLENHMGNMNSTTHDNGFAAFNGVQYLLDADVSLQNASLEYQPLINCEDASSVILSFEQRYRGFNFDKTYVEVSNNGGVSYDFAYEMNLRSYVNEIPVQETITVNITEAAAGNSEVMIRFRWETSSDHELYGSGYAWMIDDFVVYEGWNTDVKITDVYMQSGVGGLIENGMTYYQLPIDHATEIEFSAKVENFASAMQVNAKLNVEVTGPDAHVCMSEVADIAIAAKDSMVCSSSFTPEIPGTYTIKFWFDSDNVEELVSNDTIIEFITIGWETSYTRHNGLETGSIANISYNAGAPLLIGNLMQFYDDTEFHDIVVNISDDSTNLDQLIFAQIMKYNPETGEFIYLDQTDDYHINSSHLGSKVDLIFDYYQCYEENDIGLILVGHYGGDNEVHFSLAQDVEEKTVLGYTSGSTDPFYLENPQALMIEIGDMEFGHCTGTLTEHQATFNLSQNTPNPFFESTTIAYELSKNEDIQITITDLSGKTIQTINLANQTAGKHELQLNASEFAEGVYFYTFNVGDESITKRMVVL
ncbi:MAG: T9SS type A sorting domain-containing protein [Crocinitomix sp.]|nr:T9SS type A sorting domain-containing protein [Crocinitomix sp.]